MMTDTIIHLVAGGMGGTMGAIVTCPLEVVKTRLQSSNSGFGANQPPKQSSNSPTVKPEAASTSASKSLRHVVFTPPMAADKRVGPFHATMPVASIHNRAYSVRWSSTTSAGAARPQLPPTAMGVLQCLRFIYVKEGIAGLFKGLGPNLMGVFPSRAIYFWAYSTAKRNVNASLPKTNRDTPFVHVTSAGMAGFCASTLTNPIWLIKTRLQLDRSSGTKSLSIRKCISSIHKELVMIQLNKTEKPSSH